MSIHQSRRMVALAATFAVGITAASITTLSSIGGADDVVRKVPTTLVIEDVAGSTRVAVLDQYGDAADGFEPVTITVDQKCRVTNADALAGLVDLQVEGMGGTSAQLSLVQSRIGAVRGGGACNGNNARVGAGQVLSIGVGESLAEYAFTGGSLNVQSFGRGVTYRLEGLDGEFGPPQAVGTGVLAPQGLRIPPTEPFTRLEIRNQSSTGETFSLRSGGGPANFRTELDLEWLGIPITCGESYEFDELGGDTIESVTFVRFADKAEDEVCAPARLRVEVDPGVDLGELGIRDVVLIDPVGPADRIQARVLVQWRVSRSDDGGPKPPVQLNDELVRYVQYTDDSDVLFVEYCAGAEDLPGDLLDPETSTVGTVEPLAGQPWCLLAEDRTLDGDDIVQRLIFFVNGDPKFF